MIREGDSEERLFQVRQGKVSIAKQTEAGYVPLLQLQQGDFCGHLPFLDHGQEPEGATVLASEDFKVAPVDAAKLQKEFERSSSMFRNIMQNVAASIAATTTIACQFYEQAISEDVNP